MKAISRRLAVTGLLAFAVSGCAEKDPPVDRLVIATGGSGGVYHALGTALAKALEQRWGTKVTVRETPASIENLRLVAAGQADLGFASIDSVALAVSGSPPFSGSQPIRSLALLYDDYIQVVTLARDSIRELRDLAETPVSVGARESGTELIALRLLEQAGVSDAHLVRLDLAKSALALRNGLIRAFFFSGGLPTPAIAELARAMPIRLLPLGPYVAGLNSRYDGVYVPRTIPANTYGLPRDVQTFGVHNLLVVNTAMSPDLAYLITRLLFESRPVLTAAHPEARHLHERTAALTVPVPLHPGSVRYYREAKYGIDPADL